MKDIEDVGLGTGCAGVLIRQAFSRRAFEVEVPLGCIGWVTNPQRLVPSGTAGEANRAYIHAQLDAFLNTLIAEDSTPDVR